MKTEEEALKTLIENIVRNCVETTVIGHYPYVRHKCLDTFIEEYMKENKKVIKQ